MQAASNINMVIGDVTSEASSWLIHSCYLFDFGAYYLVALSDDFISEIGSTKYKNLTLSCVNNLRLLH
jgi:hypothetical protein